MPLPKPRKGQTEQEFVSMCAGSDIMNKEFPNQQQKIATCYSLYRQAKKKKEKSKKAAAEEFDATKNVPETSPYDKNAISSDDGPDWEETSAELEKDGFINLD